jgi:hypothetical protein
MSELSALSLAETVAKRAAARWLDGRRTAALRDHELTELIRERVPGLLPVRDVDRLFGAIADAVSRRSQPMLVGEFSGLPENERLAAVQATVDTLVATELDDAAARLYELLLDECCDDYVRILITLPPFVARAQSEELARFSRLEMRVTEPLARLPGRSLYAPQGADHDDEFRTEYLRILIDTLDEFELYGADATHRARARLSTGYVALNLSSDEAQVPSGHAALASTDSRRPQRRRHRRHIPPTSRPPSAARPARSSARTPARARPRCCAGSR